ncbi:hypothetical protein GYMLUDRAFT_54193 [Collybiopsis luxurians FD-317 M1]|nr:hypothetical protein GYMLUDRAFT_54193 [Collybiopsis luxurians FD-317 M1]
MVLVTLLLQVIALVQFFLLAWGLYGICAAHLIRSRGGEVNVDKEFIKDIFVGVFYIPACMGGAFVTAAASRQWHTDAIKGGTDIFWRIFPVAFVLLLLFPGVYVIYYGFQSSLSRFRSPSPISIHIPPFPAPASTSCSRLNSPALTRQDLRLIIAGFLLVPLYALLSIYPCGLFQLLDGPELMTVVDIEQLGAIIISVTCVSVTCGILVLFIGIGVQTGRRWWKGKRQQQQRQRNLEMDVLDTNP